MPTYSYIGMMSSATSGRHFSKFEKKTAENSASNGFGSNFNGAAFCLPHHSVGFLFVDNGLKYNGRNVICVSSTSMAAYIVHSDCFDC